MAGAGADAERELMTVEDDYSKQSAEEHKAEPAPRARGPPATAATPAAGGARPAAGGARQALRLSLARAVFDHLPVGVGRLVLNVFREVRLNFTGPDLP